MKTFKLLPFLLVVTTLIQLSSCGDDEVKKNSSNNDRLYPDDQFVTTWKTDNTSTHSSNETSVTIPVDKSYGDYNYEVDWDNDGVFDEVGLTEATTHDFGTAGTYTIRIRGMYPAFYFDWDSDNNNNYPLNDNYKLLSVDQWGTQQWIRLNFSYCTNFNIKASDIPDISQITDMSYMFYTATSFNSPIGNWDVSHVKDMSWMFSFATSFNQPIGHWDMNRVEDMSFMFFGATAFDQPIGNWGVSKVEDMSGMFWRATVFNQPIGHWDVSKVEDMNYMFNLAEAFNQPIGNWDVSKVEGMSFMFYTATSFNSPIGNWDVSHVKDMSWMFSLAISFNQPIGHWDVSKVEDMYFMFKFARAFNQPIGHWNVSMVEDMSEMFKGATAFSTENYDNLLISWSKISLQNYVSLHVDTQYCSTAASTARDKLINTFNWFINDSGRDAACQ